VRHYDSKVTPVKDPLGRIHYWYAVVPVEGTEEHSDRRAIEEGYVSMTPLRLDLTDYEKLEKVRGLEAWKKLRFA
jgi:5'-nucleotidase